MAASNSRTLLNTPRRSRFWVISAKKRSTVNGHAKVPIFGQVKSPPTPGVYGWVLGFTSSGTGFVEPEGLAFGHDDRGVMQQPVQQGGRGGLLR